MAEHNPVVERWLPVVGWEDYYEVSDLGRVRSRDRERRDRSGRLQRHVGRLLKQASDRRQYRRVSLKLGGKREEALVHHLVLNAFVGLRPVATIGCHGNGDASDNRLANLRWGSHSDNLYDAVRHGTHGMIRRIKCGFGHLFSGPNLKMIPSSTRRICRACERARSLKGYHTKQGHQFDVRAAADRYYEQIMSSTPQQDTAGRTDRDI